MLWITIHNNSRKIIVVDYTPQYTFSTSTDIIGARAYAAAPNIAARYIVVHVVFDEKTVEDFLEVR